MGNPNFVQNLALHDGHHQLRRHNAAVAFCVSFASYAGESGTLFSAVAPVPTTSVVHEKLAGAAELPDRAGPCACTDVLTNMPADTFDELENAGSVCERSSPFRAFLRHRIAMAVVALESCALVECVVGLACSTLPRGREWH